MKMLEKSAMVMEISQQTERFHPSCIVFRGAGHAEQDGASTHTRLELDREIWSDFGCPREITVTVEPGDTLT